MMENIFIMNSYLYKNIPMFLSRLYRSDNENQRKFDKHVTDTQLLLMVRQ
jgi:hypothetical protein